MSDLLARKQLIEQTCEKVRALLEKTYPLGMEVYRDENGGVFVVPGCEKGQCTLDLLNLREAGKTLHQFILEQVGEILQGELIPVVRLDDTPWWAQASKSQERDELPPITNHLGVIASPPDREWVANQWKAKVSTEVCTVCSLRPQGPSRKAQDRSVCDTCEQHRADRSQTWAGMLTTTIWIDEVSDINGRIALLVSQFDLTHWLDGTLIGTLAAEEPASTKQETTEKVVKNPSFARIHRVWETTRQFWQDVLPSDEEQSVRNSVVGQIIGQAGPRLSIMGRLTSATNNKDNGTPGRYHAYELKLNEVSLSVVWDPDNSRFISCDNLEYLAKPDLLGRSIKEAIHQEQTIIIEEPTGYGSKNKVWGTITIQNRHGQPGLAAPENENGLQKEFGIFTVKQDNIQEIDQSSYTPAIPILAEPRTFMALVPANKALDILQAIKAKYEREMGKVRNRLPLHLGVVYFHRRTPLRAALDAGRRMLQQKPLGGDATWRVQANATQGTLPPEKRSLADGTQQFQQTITVQLEQDGRSLTWYVPAVMGDGITPDHWYPYVFVEINGDGSRVSGRTLAFKGQRPTATDPKECWLVHAGELKVGDQVYFMPATFDFEWLDASARRFEIAYDAQGKRYGRLTRPYLLDDLDAIRQAWCLIAGPDGLTTSQIHALRDTLDARREAWYEQPGQSLNDDTFRRLCRDALCNAVWGKHPSCVDMDKLTNWAISDLLADVIELYMGIMKEKPQRNSTRQE